MECALVCQEGVQPVKRVKLRSVLNVETGAVIQTKFLEGRHRKDILPGVCLVVLPGKECAWDLLERVVAGN